MDKSGERISASNGKSRSPGHALRQHGLRPRRRLGQNFLRDRRFLERIIQAADISRGDVVLEIGAGTGVLTRELAEHGAEITAIELDDRLFQLLEEDLADTSNTKLWHGSALDFDPCCHFEDGYKLVGNIPYYITGPILRHYLGTDCRPSVLVLMVQREVAERMTAAPGKLSLLGVSVQRYARPEIVTRVPAGAFLPPPKVDSAIVRLVPHPRVAPSSAFFEVARAGFGTKRKQLANALAAGLGIGRDESRELLRRVGIDPRRRAETLSLDEWDRLGREWQPVADTD